jgi:hypothetical protein
MRPRSQQACIPGLAANSVSQLHPVYVPFKAQHQILTRVQSILEECCMHFGNSWVPELMQAQKWEEVESIELTRWIKEFSKHAKNLPPGATKAKDAESLVQTLLATSSLRHSAVHRLPTSAVGILKMVDAALAFTEVLQDTERATKVWKIKNEVAVMIEDVVQHQNLLERKLSEQLEDLATRKAEIDELERLAIEDMVKSDKNYRTAVGSAIQEFLAGLQHAPLACASEETGMQENQSWDEEPEEDVVFVDRGMPLFSPFLQEETPSV